MAMADIPNPSPTSALDKAGKAFKGRSTLFYVAFAAGIALLAWQIRKRESQVIPAPNADPVPGGEPDPVSVGSFQAYDSADAIPQNPSALTGQDVLSFVLDWTSMRNDIYVQDQQLKNQAASDAAAAQVAAIEATAAAAVTGGGLTDQPIPNVAPPAATAPAAATQTCPSAFPKFSVRNKKCYKDCHHTECSSSHKQYVNYGNCYQDGTRVHTGNTYTGKRC